MKIYIEVKTPGNNKCYEFMLDNSMVTRDARRQIINEVAAYENNEIDLYGHDVCLFSQRSEGIINEMFTLKEAGVKSGDVLLLV